MLGVLVLAVTHAAEADEPASAPAATAKAPAAKPSADAQRAKPQATSKSAENKDEAAGTSSQTTPTGDVKMSGMSILGNEDAPKSLALVPWKSSQLGDMPGLDRLLDSGPQPVDKDVFMRELAYYSFKSGSK
jgi:hypothetical protein